MKRGKINKDTEYSKGKVQVLILKSKILLHFGRVNPTPYTRYPFEYKSHILMRDGVYTQG